MNKKAIKKTNTLFTLQLKLFNKLVDVEVLTTDDKLSVVRRVCQKNNLDLKYSEQIQEKIMNSLGKVLKQDSVAPALLDKVLKFFHKASYLEDQVENQKPPLAERKLEKKQQEECPYQTQKKQEKAILDKISSEPTKQLKKNDWSIESNCVDNSHQKYQKRNQRILQLLNIPPQQEKELKFNNRRKYLQPEVTGFLEEKLEKPLEEQKYVRKRITNNQNNQQKSGEEYFPPKTYENSYSKKRNQIRERAKLLEDNDFQYNRNLNKNRSEDKSYLNNLNSRSKYNKDILNDIVNQIPDRKKDDFAISKPRSSNYNNLQNYKSSYNMIVQPVVQGGYKSRLDIHNRYSKPTNNLNRVAENDTNYYVNKKPRRDLVNSFTNNTNSKSSYSIGRKYKYLQQF